MSESPFAVSDIVARRRLNFRKELAFKGWYHSMELPDGSILDGVLSLELLKERLAAMPIPADLTGKRALDIGAWDGWYSFELERRGASVTAVDCVEVENFLVARNRLRSQVDYKELDVLEILPKNVGYFDVVLFLGVLYHLKHPLLALERVCELTRELAIVESYVVDDELARGEVFPRMEFYETDELGEQLDNWVGPSVACLLALCRTAGFARVALQSCVGGRAIVACYRHWEPPAATPLQTPPVLVEAAHYRNYGINFQTARDEYVSCAFDHSNRELGRHNVLPEVSGFGVQPIHVLETKPRSWLVTFKLPPGLAPGWHQVRLRLADSEFSNAQRIAVDMLPAAGPIRVVGIRDGVDWRGNEVCVRQGGQGFLSIWLAGLPDNADRNNVKVLVDGRRQHIEFVSEQDHSGYRQANIPLHELSAPHRATVVVHFGDARTEPVEIDMIQK